MPRLASFDLIRFPSALQALARLPMDRRAAVDVEGMVFGRLLGTASGGSTAGGADLARWAFVGVWQDEQALDRFEATHPLPARWRKAAAERWSARLVPRRSHGGWGGLAPFGPSDIRAADASHDDATGPVAVLTRASVRFAHLPAFLRARRPVDAALQQAPGRLASLGMGEWPIARQGTFSLWRDEEAVRSFAWDERTGATHTAVVRRTRQQHWYSEEWFAAFDVVSHQGLWDGRDPLRVPFRIRPAEAKDIAVLADVERDADRRFSDAGIRVPPTTVPLEDLVAGQRSGRLWVATDGREIVGFALAVLADGQPHLEAVAVRPGHGRMGAGTALVETVCAWAGDRPITLCTFRSVAWNAPWYRRLGFTELEDADLAPGLRLLTEEERAAGFDPAERVVLRRLAPRARG